MDVRFLKCVGEPEFTAESDPTGLEKPINYEAPGGFAPKYMLV